jgi:ubiquinone/menaquinone biosynthesis C-methylase UbiE
MDDAYVSFRSAVASPTVRAVWKKAYGDRFWEGAEPPWSMATKDDAAFAVDALRPGPASLIADLGCGGGCFGRHLAKTCGAKVEGIDANPLAVRLAQERAAEEDLQAKLLFKTGDLAATGWAGARFDGAASFDVLMFVPDKLAAFREIARILKPGARLVGMLFEFDTGSVSLSTPAFKDYERAFAQAGFVVERYEETADWRRLLTDSLNGLVAQEAALAHDVHPAALQRMLHWARTRPGELDDSRRMKFCVRKPA